jgi:hypothetical protein
MRAGLPSVKRYTLWYIGANCCSGRINPLRW